jgi:hypothetical protein
MRQIIFIATVVVFATGVAGFSQTVRQTPTNITTLRRVQVNTQTITALPKGKKYVVDLTQRGVRYEFDAKSRVDFSRVMVRTAQGEVPIGSFLEKVPFRKALAGFNYTSQSFIIGRALATGLSSSSDRTLPNLPSTSPFQCNPTNCSCKGTADCTDLIFNAKLCGGPIFCWTSPDGVVFCGCNRTA